MSLHRGRGAAQFGRECALLGARDAPEGIHPAILTSPRVRPQSEQRTLGRNVAASSPAGPPLPSPCSSTHVYRPPSPRMRRGGQGVRTKEAERRSPSWEREVTSWSSHWSKASWLCAAA